MILGVIADDFTGATDVASMLVRGGMRTIQTIGVPNAAPVDADAAVVALKSRTLPAEQAVAESLAALQWLRQCGARQIYFKYCSTFDSTPRGNIGPVTEALMQALDTDLTIACPAFPENGRTVYKGHLFVGETLLSESGMRDHPLTPMTDANLVRVLQAQVRSRVDLAPLHLVRQGPQALAQAMRSMQEHGCGIAIVDAIENNDLYTIAAACEGLPLITAGSGVALGLPDVYTRAGWLEPVGHASTLPAVGGQQAVLAGSCSQATRAQVAHWLALGRCAFCVDPMAIARGEDVVSQALAAWRSNANEPMLVYATAEPERVHAAQLAIGTEHAGHIIEATLARVAQTMANEGVRRIVVAGGETSGAIVKALDVQRLRIGPTITPGVPWTQAEGRPLLLALKSGNFGGPDFFSRALDMTA